MRERRPAKRFEVVELLPAMILSALLVAGAGATNAGDSSPAQGRDQAPVLEITVTSLR